MPMLGYARVSTADQDTEVQVRALQAVGVDTIITETRSGAAERPELDALLSRLRPGDVLHAYKVDRLARSLVDLLRVLQAVTDAGAVFRSLTEPIETATPAGRMMLQMLGAFAEFERAIIRERCAAGMVIARQKGVRFGRPPRLTNAQRAEAAQLGARGVPIKALAAKYDCSTRTIGRAVRSG